MARASVTTGATAAGSRLQASAWVEERKRGSVALPPTHKKPTLHPRTSHPPTHVAHGALGGAGGVGQHDGGDALVRRLGEVRWLKRFLFRHPYVLFQGCAHTHTFCLVRRSNAISASSCGEEKRVWRLIGTKKGKQTATAAWTDRPSCSAPNPRTGSSTSTASGANIV